MDDEVEIEGKQEHYIINDADEPAINANIDELPLYLIQEEEVSEQINYFEKDETHDGVSND